METKLPWGRTWKTNALTSPCGWPRSEEEVDTLGVSGGGRTLTSFNRELATGTHSER